MNIQAAALNTDSNFLASRFRSIAEIESPLLIFDVRMEWRAYCIDTSVRVSDRFSNVLTSQRWQQEETKDGNRSKALSVLCAYYPRNVETLECFRVLSLRLDHATRPPRPVAWC